MNITKTNLPIFFHAKKHVVMRCTAGHNMHQYVLLENVPTFYCECSGGTFGLDMGRGGWCQM